MIFTDKKSARKQLLAKRMNLSEEYIKNMSQALCRHIRELEEFKNADTILIYSAAKNEPDLSNIAISALKEGKNVAFPISQTDSCTLDFRTVKSLDELCVGSYGIKEPTDRANKAPITSKTLCIVPALAVDKNKCRIGYGKGYYDRFLNDFDGISVCAVFPDFICDSLPTEQTDIQIDIIISETGVVIFK